MHTPILKVPTTRQIWQFVQQGDYAFSIDLKDAYFYILVVKHYCHSFLSILVILTFCLANIPYQLKVLPFGLVMALRIFTSLAKPILFLFQHKDFCIIIYLDDILVLISFKCRDKRARSLFLVIIGLSWVMH